LGEAGVVGDGELLLELAPPVLELDAAPLPDMPLLVDPVPGVLVSAPGAGDGVGAVADGAGAGALGAGAGAGVTTLSSLLQAVRPTARMATRRSERFMFIPLGDITRLGEYENTNGWSQTVCGTIYPNVINILAASSGKVLTSSLQDDGLEAGDTRRGVRTRCVPQLAVPVQQLLCPFDLVQAARIAHVVVMEAV
jgi:hypothetical protein